MEIGEGGYAHKNRNNHLKKGTRLNKINLLSNNFLATKIFSD